MATKLSSTAAPAPSASINFVDWRGNAATAALARGTTATADTPMQSALDGLPNGPDLI